MNDDMLGSVCQVELPWATWPLLCRLGTCVTSPFSKALLRGGSMGEWER